VHRQAGAMRVPCAASVMHTGPNECALVRVVFRLCQCITHHPALSPNTSTHCTSGVCQKKLWFLGTHLTRSVDNALWERMS
jgi:hypothetical protein